MATYITRGNFSEHAFAGMLHHPEDRHDAVARMFAAAGGKLVSYYITTGEYDFMVVSEFPNGIDALTALVVAAGTGGARSLNTVTAFTTADAKKAEARARKIAASFKAAGAAG